MRSQSRCGNLPICPVTGPECREYPARARVRVCDSDGATGAPAPFAWRRSLESSLLLTLLKLVAVVISERAEIVHVETRNLFHSGGKLGLVQCDADPDGFQSIGRAL